MLFSLFVFDFISLACILSHTMLFYISQQTVQFIIGEYACHNGYVDFLAKLSQKGVLCKKKCYMHFIHGPPVVLTNTT